MIRKIPKNSYWGIAVIAVIFSISVYYKWIRPVVRGTMVYHCSDFKSQSQAQKVLVSNTEKYRYLDRNHDGKACNGLPL